MMSEHQHHQHKFLMIPNPIKTFIILTIAFVLLLVAILVPLLFKERLVFYNHYSGHSYGDEVSTLSTDTTTSGLISLYPTIQITWTYGIIQYCKTIEVISSCGYSTQDASGAGVSSGLNGLLGTHCYVLPWSLEMQSTGLENYYYNTQVVNGSLRIVGDVDASAPPVGGFPGGFPVGGGGGGSSPYSPVYTSGGFYSAFFEYVDTPTFNALRVFVILALIVTGIALFVALILAILKCSSCHHKIVHGHSGLAHLKKLLHILLVILIILWIIIIILLIVVYYQVINGLFDNPCYASIFAIALSFWLLWASYILALVALLINKCHKLHGHGHGHCHGHGHGGTTMMDEVAAAGSPMASYAGYKFGPSVQMVASPSAPPAGMATSSFV